MQTREGFWSIEVLLEEAAYDQDPLWAIMEDAHTGGLLIFDTEQEALTAYPAVCALADDTDGIRVIYHTLGPIDESSSNLRKESTMETWKRALIGQVVKFGPHHAWALVTDGKETNAVPEVVLRLDGGTVAGATWVEVRRAFETGTAIVRM